MILPLLLLTCMAAPVRADVTLPEVVGSSMVLQRGRPVPIWGKAAPGEAVSVRFAGQTRTATADMDGNWRVVLRPMRASATAATMSVTGNNIIELKDVLVGEVWLCSGQSNMQLTLEFTNDGAAVTAVANHPAIRLFNVNRRVAFQHETGPLGQWRPTSPESIKEFSAACYYFGVEIEKALGVPIGLINSSYGGTQAEAFTPIEYLVANNDVRACVERNKTWLEERSRVQAEYDEQLKQWRSDVEKAKAEGKTPPNQPRMPDALRENRPAGAVYDRMIAPLLPVSIRGVLWYQGESNEARAQQYEILLPMMIRSWRERWGEGNLPFGIVQLPNYRDVASEPADTPWAHIREAQRRTARDTPNAGLIVTIDIGEAHDIHPRNKLDVGKRMGHWALAAVYRKKMTRSGPSFREAKVAGSKIVLTFDNSGKGLRIREGDKLGEFAIAGADRQWHWAEARIVKKDKVEVWSPDVPQPVAVRYAFNSNPVHPNLTNETGLPASPFRTDNWPGPTDGKR
jgi:sialate O-acetylesterase